VASLATFVKFRLFLDAGSDSGHSTTADQFTEDRLTSGTPAWGKYVTAAFTMDDFGGTISSNQRGQFGIHWINTTGGDLDTTWTAADYTSVESALTTFWGDRQAAIPSSFRLTEFKWYNFGPEVFPPNPPVRITTLTPSAGTGTSASPLQLSTTITLRTTLRRHWGRFYVPLIGAQCNGGGGQLGAANVDAWATAARTMLLAPGAAQGVHPVVWDRVHKVAYGVTAIECDSVPDIIRKRRPSQTGYRKILTA
jgi:hypothetical protein